MKSLAELEAIRQKTLENIAMRKEVHDSARVVVGMAYSGKVLDRAMAAAISAC